MPRLRHHLTYANVMVTVLAFVVFAGGAAYAANTIFSADIVDGEVRGVDIGDNQVGSEDVRNQGLVEGGLTAIDIQNSSLTGSDIAPESLRGNDVRDGMIRSADVDDEGLTGADVDNQSGVDTCTHGSVRFGELCYFDPHERVPWRDALDLCAEREMRLPSLGEGMSLVANYDIPDTDQLFFWTEEYFSQSSSDGSQVFEVWIVSEFTSPGFTHEESEGVSAVCVTTPTN